MGGTLIIAAAMTQGLTPSLQWTRVHAMLDVITNQAAEAATAKATDTPLDIAAKDRLAKLGRFFALYRPLLSESMTNENDYFNTIQVARDTAQAYADVIRTPAAVFVAQCQALELSEAMLVIARRHGAALDFIGDQPSNRQSIRPQLELLQANVRRSFVAYLKSISPF